MSTKQEIISDATFKVWPLPSDLNFASKDGWVTAATCKHYCPLVVNPTITNCHKISILNVTEFLLDPSLETLPCTKTSVVLCENQSFFLLFQILAPLWKIIVFLCTFHSMMKISLLDGCDHYLVFMDPINGCSKLKLLVKE